MLLRFLPKEPKIHFMRFRIPAIVVSSMIIIASLSLFFMNGLNLGIDFKGGTFVEIRTQEEQADIAAYRNKLGSLGLGDIQVQTFGAPNEVLIRVEAQQGGETAQRDALAKVREALGENVEYRRVEVVGPTVSGELVEAGTIAVLVALLSVMAYIWFRFEWQFALGSVAALIHDVALTLGMFSLTQIEFNLSSIAAILTIVGYSLNDTVVVFDRIREVIRKFRKLTLIQIIDMGLNQTLSRTLMTSITTSIALFILLFFGGSAIQGLTIAMIFGVVVGTYSSIFIASPILIALKLRPEALNEVKD